MEIPVAESRVNRLLNQIRWVTRFSLTLGTMQTMDDVYSVLLSGLLSPTGLNYSHAIVFECESGTNELVGRHSIGHDSREAIRELAFDLENQQRELADSTDRIARMLSDGPDRELTLNNLAIGSEWASVFQRFNSQNAENDRVHRMRFPIREHRPSCEPLDFMSEAAYWRRPRALKKSELKHPLPEELDALLINNFVVVPLASGKRLHAMLFLDRRLESSQEITAQDLDELSYFTAQGILALSNRRLITDLERAYSDLKELDTLKSNFLSTISHELRTPLTAISGFIDLIANEKVGPLQRNQLDLLRRVQVNTSHLVNIVNDLIEVTEIEAEGIRDQQLTSVDPLVVLLTTLPRLEMRRRTQRVRVDPEIPPEGVPRVLSDERQLSRIFFHLLDNAMKFTVGEAPVRVTFEQRGDRLEIAIRDTGIGIPREKLDVIFKSFYQIDNSLTRSQEGLGLGLAVTKILVQGIRGTISVESEEGVGSAFIISVPVSPDLPEDG